MTEENPIPANQRPVRYGGLMRCCTATLQDTDSDSVVGTVLSCKYEADPNGEQMIVAADGIWEWNRTTAEP